MWEYVGGIKEATGILKWKVESGKWNTGEVIGYLRLAFSGWQLARERISDFLAIFLWLTANCFSLSALRSPLVYVILDRVLQR